MCHRRLHYFCGAPIDVSSGSPPRHGDPILCRDCKSKTDESERASGQQFTLVGEEANLLVVYTGEGGADTMTICLANNSRLGFTNPFKGVSSLPTITEESKLKKRNPAREIEIHNCGAWVTIPAHLEKKPVLITPTMNFPTNFLPHEVPTFSFHLAEVTVTAKQLSADSLMRGNVYECKEQVDDHIAFCFVLGLLDENTQITALVSLVLLESFALFGVLVEKVLPCASKQDHCSPQKGAGGRSINTKSRNRRGQVTRHGPVRRSTARELFSRA